MQRSIIHLRRRTLRILTVAVFFGFGFTLNVEQLPAQAVAPPDQSPARTWTDATGKQETEARLVAVKGQSVILQKANKKTVRVPLKRLSSADVQFVQRWVKAQREQREDAEGTPALMLDDVFPTDRVLDVQITLAEEDWDTIRYQSRNFFEALQEKRKYGPIDAPYTYVDASVTIDGHAFPKVGLRKKGFIGSQSDTRPSLKIKLNQHDKKAGIEGLTNLTLNNNKQDPAQVSQFMGYALFDAAGSPASRCAFASVTVNGKHLGIYSHVEAMRRPLVRRAFGNDQGTLYEGTVVDFHAEWENSFEHKFGDDAVGREKIKQLIDVLRDQDVDERTIGELIDLDSFYKFWAIEGLIGFWDGYSGNRNNFYVYLNSKTDRFHFLPWGADSVFRKFGDLGNDRDTPISVKTIGLVAHKLYQIEACRERYAKTLNELLSEHWDEKVLLAETDRIEAMLKPHLGPSLLEHQKALEGVREFIRSRRADLLAEMSNGMPVWTRVPDAPPVIPAAMAKSQGADSIWNAAKAGDVDGIKRQLAEGTDVDARDFTGTTPLGIAALAGRVEATKFLIGKGADVDVKSNDNQTPLHGAAFLGRVEIVELFIENGVQVNARNNDGATPFDNAATPWNTEMQNIVDFLAGILQVKIDVADVQAGRPKVAALLRKHGGKSGSELPKPTGDTIWASAKLGNLDALKRHLASVDADPNAHDDKGVTPLSWAAMAGQYKAVELLIQEGAKVDGKNRDGAAALHSAAFLGHLDVVELLIENKAHVNAKNNMGQTALATVAGEWNEQIKGITQFIATFLTLEVDLEKVEAARPKIAKLLRQHGGKAGAER